MSTEINPRALMNPSLRAALLVITGAVLFKPILFILCATATILGWTAAVVLSMVIIGITTACLGVAAVALIAKKHS